MWSSQTGKQTRPHACTFARMLPCRARVLEGSLSAAALCVCTHRLLMYLADEEVQSLAQRMLEWLTPGGTLFFRESCFKQSGDKPRKDNPTHYR